MAVWGYKMEKGLVVSKLFDETLPRGWKDSPAKCVKKAKANGDD